MGARVSVTPASHAGAAARSAGSSGATRDAAPSAENGFSSQLSAAARRPTGADAPSEARPGPSANGSTRAPGSSKAGAAGGAAAAKPSDPTTSEAQDAAAPVTEADASSIDADLATQPGKAPGKAAGKSRADGSQTSADAADPATLALLLAASGMQVDARAGQGEHSGAGNAAANANCSTDDGAAAAIAGGVAAASVAPTAAPAAQSSAPADAALSSASAGAAAPDVPPAADSLQLGGATPDSSDASILQTKSSASDALQPQPGAVAANGLPPMMRGLGEALTPSAAVERTVSIPISDRSWGGAVGNQVQWLVNHNIQSATLQVSPEHLGPVEVHIDVQSSQVNVSFTAAHADTRGALEQSVPQLRAILAGGGLTLGHTTVQQEARSNSQYPRSPARGSAGSAQTVDAISISPTRGLGLIDEYA